MSQAGDIKRLAFKTTRQSPAFVQQVEWALAVGGGEVVDAPTCD
jgi:hypothetical protein